MIWFCIIYVFSTSEVGPDHCSYPLAGVIVLLLNIDSPHTEAIQFFLANKPSKNLHICMCQCFVSVSDGAGSIAEILTIPFPKRN